MSDNECLPCSLLHYEFGSCILKKLILLESYVIAFHYIGGISGPETRILNHLYVLASGITAAIASSRVNMQKIIKCGLNIIILYIIWTGCY